MPNDYWLTTRDRRWSLVRQIAAMILCAGCMTWLSYHGGNV